MVRRRTRQFGPLVDRRKRLVREEGALLDPVGTRELARRVVLRIITTVLSAIPRLLLARDQIWALRRMNLGLKW